MKTQIPCWSMAFGLPWEEGAGKSVSVALQVTLSDGRGQACDPAVSYPAGSTAAVGSRA